MKRLILCICAGIPVTVAQAAEVVTIDDFESGDYNHWTVEGAAFGKGPLEIEGLDSPLAKTPTNANGEKLYFPGRQGKFVAHSAPDRNYGPQGKLTSQPFAIERPTLKFLIGGGSSPSTRMDLMVDGKVVRSASGDDLHGVVERMWDLAEFKGRQGVLQIVDASSGNWGFIAVDRILLSDSPTSPPWVEDPKDFLTLRPVQQMAGAPWPDGWVRDPNAKLLFMGDSITANWDGNAFRKFCVNRSYVNLGRSMEQVAHLLWRLDHIDCEGAQAKLIVLMIGSNDGACDFSSQDVAAGVAAVVAKLRAKMPQTKVLVMSILPRGDRPKARQPAFTTINPMIAKLADGKDVFYLDICGKYFGENDKVNPALLGDLVHPTGKGFEIWAEAMEPLFKKLLDGN
jgi:lysophospholipase L1-like esterase